MAETNSIRLTFGYEDTDYTRVYKIDDVAYESLTQAKAKIKAINASLAAGTAGGLSEFFLSEDGDHFVSIVAAQADCTTVEAYDLNE